MGFCDMIFQSGCTKKLFAAAGHLAGKCSEKKRIKRNKDKVTKLGRVARNARRNPAAENYFYQGSQQILTLDVEACQYGVEWQLATSIRSMKSWNSPLRKQKLLLCMVLVLLCAVLQNNTSQCVRDPMFCTKVLSNLPSLFVWIMVNRSLMEILPSASVSNSCGRKMRSKCGTLQIQCFESEYLMRLFVCAHTPSQCILQCSYQV